MSFPLTLAAHHIQVQPSTAQYSTTAQYNPVQRSMIHYSPVQPSTAFNTPLQLSTAQLQPSTSQYSLSSLLTLSNLLPYLPFQKLHTLLCLVLSYSHQLTKIFVIPSWAGPIDVGRVKMLESPMGGQVPFDSAKS